LNQVDEIGFDPAQIAEVLEPGQHDVNAVRIAGELAAGIEQRLQKLVIRGENHLEIGGELPPPELECRAEWICRECCGDGKFEAAGMVFVFPQLSL
jgi:hypothetical protein